MATNVPAPYFGNPPASYDQRYFADLTRAFAQYISQANNPGQGRFTTVVLTSLQTHDQGLEVGAVFEQNGFLKVARAHVPHPAGIGAQVTVGTVSVVTV
jgi:hypothetical protein